jgi:hypothetical protein
MWAHRPSAGPEAPQFTELAIDCAVLILLLRLTGRWERIGPTRAARVVGGPIDGQLTGDPLDHGLGLVAGLRCA